MSDKDRLDKEVVVTLEVNDETESDDDLDEEIDEEMLVTLELDDGTSIECAVITIFEMNDRDYIALLPLDEKGASKNGEVWIYRYHENPDDPNEEPELEYIEDDEEYDAAIDAFDEFLDSEEYDELYEDE